MTADRIDQSAVTVATTIPDKAARAANGPSRLPPKNSRLAATPSDSAPPWNITIRSDFGVANAEKISVNRNPDRRTAIEADFASTGDTGVFRKRSVSIAIKGTKGAAHTIRAKSENTPIDESDTLASII